jgi:NADH:ubiquinone oxidoreductase subunit 6 (subunit J)
MSGEEPTRTREAHLSYHLLIAVLGLVLFTMLYAILQQPVSMMESYAADQTRSNAAATGISYVSDFWTYTPFLVVVLFAFSVIFRALNERPGKRR